MKIDNNDPRLTAYALGELDERERAEVEALLKDDEAARREVETIRRAGKVLADELEAEPCPRLSAEQLAEIRKRFAPRDEEARVFSWWQVFGWGVAVTGVLVIAAGMMLPALSSSRQKARRLALHTPEQHLYAPPAPSVSDKKEQTWNTRGFVYEGPVGGQSGSAVSPAAPAENNPGNALGDAHARQSVGSTVALGINRSPVGGRVDWYEGSRRPENIVIYRSAEEELPVLTTPGTESYAHTAENAFISTAQNPLSTFGLDVDTASYANIRRFLSQGTLPPRDAVRIEEMLNYFTYDYPAPRRGEPFALYVEAGECPWNPAHRLALVGLKAKDIVPRKAQPMNLVFLIDVSGSMQPPNKLPLIKEALRLLVEQLTARDRVAIVVYANDSRVVLRSTRGDDKETILAAIDSLEAGGSTNGGAGIQSAYREATGNFIEGGVNRVILCTDGDFNVGITDQSELVRLIQQQARSGVFLSVLGFGMGNLKDSTMQKLADKGNGNYAYVDDIVEARKILVDQMRSTLVTVAKDAKLQIEFNPAHVKSYRLIGYEKRMLREQDFANDRKDAGDIGAGHTVTALYELVPEYEGGGVELMKVNLRYKDPEASTSKLLSAQVRDENTSWRRTSSDFRFAAAVATFGMILRDSPYKGAADCDLALQLAAGARGRDDNGYRQEFINLVSQARTLGGGAAPDDP